MKFASIQAGLILLCSLLPSFAEPVDFARDVLPVLSDACFHCHGPDEEAREAKLRLDTKDGLYRTLDGITVVTPGKVADSELIARILSHDEEEIMPPKKATRQLTAAEIATLKRWVEEGAPYGTHWAYTPMKKPELPAVQNASWPVNEIDRFVLARLETEKLSPSPASDKERLIRRLTLDLTGLPPTPAETDAFLANQTPTAYEQLVDRLLASPRYGERVATEWLDLARYADTHGYQADRYRPMWPYRDWVIKAFNDNLPFDQFATWQLAGDLLPNATREQRLATAFNRLHNQNEEGGIVEEEFRVAYVVDRVNTFGTAFLGATFECARCHDHKYDPITARDTYSMFSFFQNIDESGQTSHFTEAMPVPAMLLSTDEQDKTLASYHEKIVAKEKEVAAMRETASTAFAEWLKDKGPPPEIKDATVAFDFESMQEKTLSNAADAAKPGKVFEEPKLVPGKVGQGALLDGENGFFIPGAAHFNRADAFSTSIWVRPAHITERAVIVHHSKAPIDAGSRGYELLLENGRVAFGLHYMWPGNSLKVLSKTKVEAGAWTHLTVTYDGSSRAAGTHIYLNGSLAELEIIRDGLTKDITYGAEPDLAIGYRFRDAGFKDGMVDEFRVFHRALTSLEAGQLAGRDDLQSAWNAPVPTPEQNTALFEFFIQHIHPPAKQAASELHAARDEQRLFIEAIPEIMVMQELPQPKKAFILKRGDYDQHGEEVTADTPKFLPPFPANAPRNRLGLAHWLLDPEHPLTSRVTVNRAWQMMFGRGLVETSDNFGTQGAAPTHPELLDWLARDFIADGWNYKALLKKIAMSATYQQASHGNAPAITQDPQNLLLARSPVRRLTAEMLRDQALASSGLLVEKTGGPSVKPYQPPGLWEELVSGKPNYGQGTGDDLHRRTLYTFWKRTVPPPSMVTFDAADRSYCTVKRQSTSTPLQALALLNDVQIVEAARFIGQRMIKEGGADTDARTTFVFRLITGRHPQPKEKAILNQMYEEQLALFTAQPENAGKLVQFGEAKSDSAIPPAELAAATVLAKAILNHDEAVFRR